MEEKAMRGQDARQEAMFSDVMPEQRVAADHPLRRILKWTDAALVSLNGQFAALYAPTGRNWNPPERLLRALLVQALLSVRSERQLMEQLNYNLLYRGFVGLGMDDEMWDVTVFTKNRDRLLDGRIAQAFFDQVLQRARTAGLLSDDHFTVDGTLIEAWASHKSFKRKDTPPEPPQGKNPDADFKKEKRSNKTHQSTTDPEARLYRKSKAAPAQLCYMGHAVLENRNGMAMRGRVSEANGTAERDEALQLLESLANKGRITLGADKNYDTRGFVNALRSLDVTPQVAQNTTHRSSAIDKRTTRHRGYAVSQRRRKLVEEIFGWLKKVGGLRKTRHRGRAKVDWMFVFGLAAYNLVRMVKWVPAAA
jgi:transposase